MADLLKRKWKTAFHRLDLDGDGFLTSKDFAILAERLIQAAKVDGERAEKIKNCYQKAFQMQQDAAGGKDALSVDDILNGIESVDMEIVESNSKLLSEEYFKAIDTNQDGFIQWREFENVYKILGVETVNAKESFDAIDTNKDGILSKDEFIAAGVEFSISKEDTPSKLLYGPLVD